MAEKSSSGGRGTQESKGRRQKPLLPCPFCGRQAAFYWTCPCGFRMCQDCMNENAWGLTCNNLTWTCPDCGRDRSY
jgi:hypothetical protein